MMGIWYDLSEWATRMSFAVSRLKVVCREMSNLCRLDLCYPRKLGGVANDGH